MELVHSVCIGSFLAFFLKYQFAIPKSAIDIWLALGLALFPFLRFSPSLIRIFVSIWSCAWVILHSPAHWKNLRDVGEVYESTGCGDASLDVLVNVGGKVYLTNASALAGDLVELRSYNSTLDYSRAISVIQSGQKSILCSISSSIRANILRKFADFPDGTRRWLESFVLGLDSKLDSVTNSSLRKLGLLHIVVLSGAHLTLVAALIMHSLQLIPICLFAMRMISMKVWPKIWLFTLSISVFFVYLFANTVGFSQSIQRSMVMFVIFRMSSVGFLNLKNSWHRIQFAWCVQCLIFPINLWSTSNLLSWSGALIVNANVLNSQTHNRKKSDLFSRWIQSSVVMQCHFGVLALIVFSASGLGQVIANLVFGPFFALALGLNTWIVCFGYNSYVSQLIAKGQTILLSRVIQTAAYFDNYSQLYFSLPRDNLLVPFLNELLLVTFIVYLVICLEQKSNDKLN